MFNINGKLYVTFLLPTDLDINIYVCLGNSEFYYGLIL